MSALYFLHSSKESELLKPCFSFFLFSDRGLALFFGLCVLSFLWPAPTICVLSKTGVSFPVQFLLLLLLNENKSSIFYAIKKESYS
jgi:hypothetical protein